MKRIFMIAAVCYALVSCGNANNTQNGQNDESSTSTEVNTNQVEIQKADFESMDYKIYALRGRVKYAITYANQCEKDFNTEVTKEFGDTIEFSQDGKVIHDEIMVRIGFRDWPRNAVRDNNGQLQGLDLDDEESNTALTYDDNGFLKTISDKSSEHETILSFVYNADNEESVRETCFMYYYDEGDECMSYDSKTEYTIVERDSKGNWTKRQSHCASIPRCKEVTNDSYVLEVRDIVYF